MYKKIIYFPQILKSSNRPKTLSYIMGNIIDLGGNIGLKSMCPIPTLIFLYY